jgi:hypothetical protein
MNITISFSALLLLLIIEFKFQVKFLNVNAFKINISFLDACILQEFGFCLLQKTLYMGIS